MSSDSSTQEIAYHEDMHSDHHVFAAIYHRSQEINAVIEGNITCIMLTSPDIK